MMQLSSSRVESSGSVDQGDLTQDTVKDQHQRDGKDKFHLKVAYLEHFKINLNQINSFYCSTCNNKQQELLLYSLKRITSGEIKE